MEKQVSNQVERMRRETFEAYEYAQEKSDLIPSEGKEDQVGRMRRETFEAYAYAQKLSDQKRAEEALLERGNENQFDFDVSIILKHWKEMRKLSQDQASEQYPADEEMLVLARTRINTEFYRKAMKIAETIKRESGKELWFKEDYFANLGWLHSLKMKKTHKRFSKLIPLMDFNDRQTINSKDHPEFGAGVIEDKERYPSLLIVNKGYFKSATKDLELSQITIQKMNQKLCHIEKGCEYRLIKQLGLKFGKAVLYTDGYYMRMPSGSWRKIHYIKSTPKVRKFFEEFNYNE